ncbi:hypothetical protein ACFO5K_18725 [Nocardia halotolerans]|uniref:PH domain-containing protein n=1 Tax=Nocardia halotolerans TaxID=1755878 RepID=A0ABV8VMW6_9NOCA
MAIDDTGPGSAGSPEDYRWVCHTWDPPRRSRIVASSSALAAALLIAAAGHFTDSTEVYSLGVLCVVVALIALTHSLMVLTAGAPKITVGERPGSLALRYRPVAITPILLTCAVFAPPTIAVGYVNAQPEVILMGIFGLLLAIAASIVVARQLNKAYLEFGPDSVRVASIFDDIECEWDDVHSIRVSEDAPALDTVCVQHAEGALHIRKRTRGVTAGRLRRRTWLIIPSTWSVPTNSLASTMIFLHQNPAARDRLDENQLAAMLTVPEWAMPRRTMFGRTR